MEENPFSSSSSIRHGQSGGAIRVSSLVKSPAVSDPTSAGGHAGFLEIGFGPEMVSTGSERKIIVPWNGGSHTLKAHQSLTGNVPQRQAA